MLTNETISKLNEMHLGTMASHFADQLTDPQFQSLSFEERFSILVDAEWSSRKSNRLTKLIKKAGYSEPGASIEDISFLPERKLDKAQILRLASCSYIQQAQNVIILGATGTGKLPEPEALVQYILRHIGLPHDLAGKKVLACSSSFVSCAFLFLPLFSMFVTIGVNTTQRAAFIGEITLSAQFFQNASNASE